MRISTWISIVFCIGAIILIAGVIAPEVFGIVNHCVGWDLLECVINDLPG